MSIVHTFSGRLYGLRRYRRQIREAAHDGQADEGDAPPGPGLASRPELLPGDHLPADRRRPGAGPGTLWLGAGEAFARKPLPGTLIVLHAEGHEDPWVLLTDTPPKHTEAALYACRHWIEQGFRGLKRGGWQWGRTRRTDPVRVARHLLALAAATLLAVAYGTRCEQARDAAPFQRTAAGRGLPPPPAGPQPPVGPRLAHPHAGPRPRRRPALPVVPRRLKPAPPFHSPPAPAEAAPPRGPTAPARMPTASPLPNREPPDGEPVAAGCGTEHGPQHPGTSWQGRNTRLMHPENTLVKHHRLPERRQDGVRLRRSFPCRALPDQRRVAGRPRQGPG